MFDFTLDDQNAKDSYIVDVHINDNGTYSILFASGREEVFPFSIHNFQVELYRMEHQYEEYGRDYLEKVTPNHEIISAMLLGMLLAVDISYFKHMLEEGFSFTGVWCLAYGMYVILRNGIPQIKKRKLYMEAKEKLALIQMYLENKEQFKVRVSNPFNGELEDWYLVDLASIDQFKNRSALQDYMNELSPSKKEEEGKKLSLQFQSYVKGEIEC